jgi:ketosteroid isomerase-like protein
MSPNADVMRRCIDAISRRDGATLTELSTPDVTVRPLRAALEDTVYRGREGIDQWMRDIDETWAELTVDIQEISEPEPDIVVAKAMLYGRGHESKVPTRMPVELVAELRDGLIAHATTVITADS